MAGNRGDKTGEKARIREAGVERAASLRTGGEGPGDALAELTASLRPGAVTPVLGIEGAARGWVGAKVAQARGPLLAIAATEEAADALAGDLRFFLGSKEAVVRIPVDAVLPYDGLAPERSAELDRLAGLAKLHQGAQAAVVSAKGLARRTLPPTVLDESVDEVSLNQTLDRDDFAKRLVELGYQNVPLVEDPGSFSVRGAIVDLWSPSQDQPTRLELFGDDVESLRAFDPTTQRSGEALSTLVITPVREVLVHRDQRQAAIAAIREAGDRANHPTAQTRALVEALEEGTHVLGLEGLLPALYEGGLASLFDHLPEGTSLLVDDPLSVERSLEELWEDLPTEYDAAVDRGKLALPPQAHFLEKEDIQRLMAPFPALELHRLWLGGAREPLRFDAPSTAGLRKELQEAKGESALSPLVSRLRAHREEGHGVAIACSSRGQADKIARLLESRKLTVKVHDGAPTSALDTLWDGAVHAHLFRGELSSGFAFEAGRFVVLSDVDILGTRPIKRRRGASKQDLPSISAFRDLKEGDLCVHADHGVCRYEGLQKMQFQGVEADFLVLHFAGADKLYLPVWKLRLVQKFVGAGSEHTRLDRLGGTSWEKTKKKVKNELLKMAAELLDLYARRKAHEGHAFPKPDAHFEAFEASFPFQETPDQAQAIRDVIDDMQKPAPMDRLVCGDVGFGKTEVAMRAAYLAALGGKQVAVLVPTTLLALQHHRSFVERMAGYPVVVDWVSSLRTAKENRETLRKVAAGEVDIVIGTHALLAPTVSFADLGLLVIDEEHRFGVAHKEKMKRWRANIDVLTLTATPIPRTLNMSMAGMRDMSIIRTPPPARRAIRTFLLRFSPTEIREAILREKARGGQVFFVHDRVESIGGIRRFLEELVPEVAIEVAHGQMKVHALEKVIGRFLSKEVDVLLSTTIVESGLDIPSANTILINRADTFGLAQLHQLRGRVGRSSERAYAYLLLPAERQVTKDAQKRLEVLQNFSELGSGFHIASHDLEIRGAGHLLGAKQSGQIEAVGFDLYVELLDEAVAQVRGEPLRRAVDPDVQIPVPAFIPEPYLPDVHQRLLFYKKLSQANSPEEIEEVREELVDLCGHPPPEVDALCSLMELKAALRAQRLRGLEVGPSRLAVILGPDAELDPEKLAALIAGGAGRYRLTPELKLIARIEPNLSPEGVFGAAREILDQIAACAT